MAYYRDIVKVFQRFIPQEFIGLVIGRIIDPMGPTSLAWLLLFPQSFYNETSIPFSVAETSWISVILLATQAVPTPPWWQEFCLHDERKTRRIGNNRRNFTVFGAPPPLLPGGNEQRNPGGGARDHFVCRRRKKKRGEERSKREERELSYYSIVVMIR